MTVVLPNAPCGAYVVEIRSITGDTCYSGLHDDYTLSNGLTVDTSHLQQGSYLVRIIFGNKSETKKITIRR